MKRQDAKASACLLAIYKGIVAQVETIVKSCEEKLSPEMRRKASEVMLPLLMEEYRRVKPGADLPFIHEQADGGMGRSPR